MKENNQIIGSVIVGSGSYIPTRVIPNEYFIDHEFYDADGAKMTGSNERIIRKFKDITGISERRYVTDDLMASDIAYLAAKDALESSGIDPETLDYIIVAHNFGDIRAFNLRSDMVPALASRVKHHLGIKNPCTIPYDLPFGCPGWLQGFIQAHYFLRSGDARRVMVIGAETLSRICDPHDRDSMIYADGAGAVILEAVPGDGTAGVISHHVESYTSEHAFILKMGPSYKPDSTGNEIFLKMKGRKVYELALKAVPAVIQKSLEKADLPLSSIDKILIHQANLKMDEAIVEQLFKLNGLVPPGDIMPMTISRLGNTSVATLPTLYDLIVKGRLAPHVIAPGNHIVFSSVGAGLNINSVVYRMPT